MISSQFFKTWKRIIMENGNFLKIEKRELKKTAVLKVMFFL